MNGNTLATAALLALCLAAGPEAAAQDACQPIGRIDVDGKNAFRNDKQLARNAKNVTLCAGDEVRTRGRTSAIITAGPVRVQADQNTTLFATIGSGIKQLLKLLLGRGQLAVDGSDVEISTASMVIDDLGSTVNVAARGGSTVLTVVNGHAHVARPTPETVGENTRYLVPVTGAPQMFSISADEAKQSIEWTNQYFVPSTGQAHTGTILGILAALMAGYAIHEHNTGHDDAIWCCGTRNDLPTVFRTQSDEECTTQHGRPFRTEAEARSACGH